MTVSTPTVVDPDAVLPLPKSVSSRLRDADFERLIDSVVEADMRDVFVEHQRDDAFRRLLRQGVSENIGTLRSVLFGTATLDDVSPAVPLSVAIMQAQVGVSDSALQDSYRVGSIAVFQWWFDLVHDRLEASPEVMQATARLTSILLAMHYRIVHAVGAAFREELASLRASHARMRQEVVRGILRGDTIEDQRELSAGLAYGLSGSHLAVIVKLDGDARTLTASLLHDTNATEAYTMQQGAATHAIWLGRPSRWSGRQVGTVIEVLRQAHVHAAVGAPGSGVDGFRQTHQQAMAVEALRSCAVVDDIASYADLSLELLLEAESPSTASFVRRELGELAADTTQAASARQALLAWYATGSHVATAALIGVHEHTVRNRLNRAQTLLGHPVSHRRMETQAALRIHALTSLNAHQPRPASRP